MRFSKTIGGVFVYLYFSGLIEGKERKVKGKRRMKMPTACSSVIQQHLIFVAAAAITFNLLFFFVVVSSSDLSVVSHEL